MGTMVYSLLWVMQDFVHQPYRWLSETVPCVQRRLPSNLLVGSGKFQYNMML